MTRDVPEAELRAARRGAERKAFELRTGALPEDGIWWLHRRALPDGRELYLQPMGYGMLYLQTSPDAQAQSFDNTWAYDADNHDAAWRAALGWDGEGEPDGWFRHPNSGRARAKCPECLQSGPVCSEFATLICEHCGARFNYYPRSRSQSTVAAAVDSGLRYWVDRGIVNPAVIEGQGGATPPGEFTCPTCGCFIGQRIENGVAVTRCQHCAPEPVPNDAGERTLLSLQSRWAHAECSCEQVAAEAIAVIRQLTLDASAERARLSTQVAALSALAETILRPPPEIQEVYDLQMRLVPHCDELDRVLGSDDRSLLNYTLGAVHGMHLRIQKLESGQGPADDGGPDMKPAPRDLNGEIIEWVRSCKGEPTLHILAALMGNAVNLARALDFSLARFISGIEMHWGLFSAAAARKQGEASGAPSVSALLRALQGKSQ